MINSIYFGVIEDRNDPLKLGRCKVRVAGMHTHDKQVLPTEDLPWALVMQTPGQIQTTIPEEGSEVVVMYGDQDCQIPIIVGRIPTLPQDKLTWINEFPDTPKQVSVDNTDIKQELPKNDQDQAQDLNKQSDQINQAASDTSDAVKVVADENTLDQSTSNDPVEQTITHQLGNAEPSIKEKILDYQITNGVGDNPAIAYAIKLASQFNSDVCKKIANGQTSLSVELGRLQEDVSRAKALLGSKTVAKILTPILSNNSRTMLSAAASALTTKDITNHTGTNQTENESKQQLQSVIQLVKRVQSLGTGVSNYVFASNGLGQLVNNLKSNKISQTITSTISSKNSLITNVNNIWNLGNNFVGNYYSQVSNQINELSNSGLNITSVGDIVGSQGAAIGLALQRDAHDLIGSKIRQLFAIGYKATYISDSIVRKVESAIPAIKLAIKLTNSNVDSKELEAKCNQFLSSFRAALTKNTKLLQNTEINLTSAIDDILNDSASRIFEALGIGQTGVQTVLKTVNISSIFDSTISSILSNALGSGGYKTPIGIKPQAIADNINSNSFTSNTTTNIGNRENIDKTGESKTNSQMFACVGEGNTPPSHGMWGGANYGGGTLKNNAVDTSIKDDNKYTSTNRTINTKIPDIPLTIYGVSSTNVVQQNIDKLVPLLQQNLPTIESQACFLALSFTYCHCVPIIHDYEYNKEQLLSKFPKSFVRASDQVIDVFVNARSQQTKTAEDFYNYVYDSAKDGQSLGNINIGDGIKYAEGGLLPIVGRNQYSTLGYSGGVSELINDFDKAAVCAIKDFISNLNGLTLGSVNLINQVLQRYSGIDKDLAIKAYEHFYQAKTFNSYQTTSKTAGPESTSNSYYGSETSDANNGFEDPNGKYPYKRDRNTAATNKLARGVIVNTIVTKKESERLKNVPIANSDVTWDQPHSGYQASYPYNRVIETESGHVIEYDDTPGHERLQWYHRKGTFTEISELGSKCTRVVGDNYEIVDRNGMISIAGDACVTVNGNVKIFCRSDASIEVNGTTDIISHGNFNVAAGNDINFSAGGSINLWSNKGSNVQCNDNLNIRSKSGDLNLTGNTTVNLYGESDVNVTSGKDLNVNSTGLIAVESDDSSIDIRGANDVRITADSGSLDCYSGSNTNITAISNINVNGTDIGVQANGSYNTLVSNDYKLSSNNYDLTTNSHTYIDSKGQASINSNSSISVTGDGNVGIRSNGAIDVNGTSTLRIGSGGDVSVNGGGTVGIDGTVIGLNSGMSSKPQNVSSINASKASETNKATVANQAVPGDKAVLYGMATITQGGKPLYPNLKLYDTVSPLLTLVKTTEPDDLSVKPDVVDKLEDAINRGDL